MKNYAHIVSVDSEKKLLKIYRLFDDDRREFLTECPIDEISAKSDWDKFSLFAQQLGENILMDSPAARQSMEI